MDHYQRGVVSACPSIVLLGSPRETGGLDTTAGVVLTYKPSCGVRDPSILGQALQEQLESLKLSGMLDCAFQDGFDASTANIPGNKLHTVFTALFPRVSQQPRGTTASSQHRRRRSNSGDSPSSSSASPSPRRRPPPSPPPPPSDPTPPSSPHEASSPEHPLSTSSRGRRARDGGGPPVSQSCPKRRRLVRPQDSDSGDEGSHEGDDGRRHVGRSSHVSASSSSRDPPPGGEAKVKRMDEQVPAQQSPARPVLTHSNKSSPPVGVMVAVPVPATSTPS